jgi:transketolase
MPGDNELDRLRAIARQLRRNIVKVTRAAGSGHPSSAASAVELMTVLFFGGVLRYDVSRPDHPNNDRLIFSKGHASPLFYALWAAAGARQRPRGAPASELSLL